MSSELETYKKYVRRKLDALSQVFARASIGDFSTNVDVPDEDDEFTELYVGVQIILEVIREKIKELEEANKTLALQVKDLARLNKFMVGRELRIVELKAEVIKLEKLLAEFRSKK